jgi:hypothetical protein
VALASVLALNLRYPIMVPNGVGLSVIPYCLAAFLPDQAADGAGVSGGQGADRGGPV